MQVIVTVPRDTQPPAFQQERYTARLAEEHPLDARVVDVRAVDANLQVTNWH